MGTIVTRNTDKKARVTLPKDFAEHLVIIEQIDETEVRVKKARAIPENELWLWQNPAALGAVMQGLAEAQAGRMVAGPDLDADASRLSSSDDGDDEDE